MTKNELLKIIEDVELDEITQFKLAFIKEDQERAIEYI